MTEARPTYSASDGSRLALYDWPVEGATRAVLLVHGLGEHAGRYELLARWLNAQRVSVRAFDLYGHGHSSGARGGLAREGQLPEHLGEIAAAMAAEPALAGRPLIVIGHSLGGLIVASAIRRGLLRPRLAVLSSPALAVRMASWQRAVVKVFPHLVPQLTLGNGLDPHMLSHDPKVVADYVADPLVHDRICARLGAFVALEGEAVRAEATSWSTPTLLLYAGDDRAVDPAGSRAFSARAPASVVKSRCYERMYHEIFNEPDRALVLNDLGTALAAVD